MIRLFNTLSVKIEDFKPLRDGEVGMYHCGPTVYNYAHIGNLRSYVFADILRRTFEYSEFKVNQVINITDIGHLTSDADSGDDKMMKGLKREDLPFTLDGLKQLADKYEDAFKQDLDALNILTPQHFPRATKYLDQEINLIKKLEEKGFTYTISDGVYFDTSKDKNYGRLGGIGGSESRIAPNSEKKNPKDFVLWKISADDHLGFASPWGTGFPGWHIECSAMSRELLGQPFDIHTGGIDHIPVHHNNEIAQSEAAYDTLLANYWLHNEFVITGGDKMAKSENNFITLKTLEDKGYSPLAYRCFLLLSNYRTPTNFTLEALEAAANAHKRLQLFIVFLDKQIEPGAIGSVNETYKKKFISVLENDLNTPEAIAIVWNLAKNAGDDISFADAKATLLDFDKVLGLKLDENSFEVKDISSEVQTLLDERQTARDNKDFVKSDKLRDDIKTLGFEVKDTENGQTLSKI